MSTKKETTSNINYDQTATNAYHDYLGTTSPILQDMAKNPYGNSFFNLNRSMLNNQAVGMGQTGVNTAVSNARNSGFSSMPGFVQSMVARQGRATSGLQAQGLWQAMQQGQQNQLFALNSMQSFQPLMTGQHSIENTSGLGTWLPQLAGAAIGGFTGGLGGALGGKLLGGIGGGGGGASQVGGGATLASGGSYFNSGNNFGTGMNPFSNTNFFAPSIFPSGAK